MTFLPLVWTHPLRHIRKSGEGEVRKGLHQFKLTTLNSNGFRERRKSRHDWFDEQIFRIDKAIEFPPLVLNFTVTVRCMAAGRPSSRAGSYFHRRTASLAASRNRMGPEITLRSRTLPDSSTNASRVTSPAVRFARAIGG